MLTDATNSIALAQQNAAQSLAASATFQDLVGAGTDAELAMDRIYHEGLPPPANGDSYTLAELGALRPYAEIWTDPQNGFALHAVTANDGAYGYLAAGRIKIELVQDIPSDIALDPAEIDRRWRNTVGGIADDLAALSGQPGYLEFLTLEAVGPYRLHPHKVPTQGDAQGYELTLTYDERGHR